MSKPRRPISRRAIKRWAWSYAADVIRADATAGYFDSPEGYDRQACIAALMEVAATMTKKSLSKPQNPDHHQA